MLGWACDTLAILKYLGSPKVVALEDNVLIASCLLRCEDAAQAELCAPSDEKVEANTIIVIRKNTNGYPFNVKLVSC